MASFNTVWAPQAGPQTLLLECPTFEVLYGGARGGGKTDGFLGDWLIHADRVGKHANGLWLRRQMPQSDDVISRARDLFEPHFATWRSRVC